MKWYMILTIFFTSLGAGRQVARNVLLCLESLHLHLLADRVLFVKGLNIWSESQILYFIICY